MSPLLSYSGGGQGRGRGGGSGRGRGYGRGGRGGGGRYSYVASSHSQINNSRQWVRPKAKDESASADDGGGDSKETKVHAMNAESNNTAAQQVSGVDAETKSTSEVATSVSNSKHTIMRKHGRNQLILSNTKTKQNSVTSTTNKATDDTSATATAGQTVMMREGKNKLVAVKAAAAASHSTVNRKQPPPPFGSGRKPPLRHGSSVAGGRTHSTRSKSGTAKRIKLTVPASDAAEQKAATSDEDSSACKSPKHEGTEEALTTIDDGAGQNERIKEPHQSTTTEKLTDFAYRETSRVKPKAAVSQNMHWSKTKNMDKDTNAVSQKPPNAKLRNMGLVRVQPNEKKTPICPTFLRGLQCQDEFCRKRHDVPRDFATPVCSFFQRHGQCLRGDECVFRHVKVNPRAMVCPSFSLLGFCEDESCAMQHVSGKSKTLRR